MRSWLFTPGDSEKKCAKGLATGADALILDLEDSVGPAAKDAAREHTAAFLTTHRKTEDRPRLFVRINGLDTHHWQADLKAVMGSAPDGIMLPKCRHAQDADALSAALEEAERSHGLEIGSTQTIAITTETAASIFGLQTYQQAGARLMAMTWGSEDLSADLGAATARDDQGHFTDAFALARTLVLYGAVAANRLPIDSIVSDFRNLDGLREECRVARRDGFVGKLAIHPAQIPIINEAFTPTAEEVDLAQRIIEAFAAAGDGTGVIAIDGQMYDAPHLKRARVIIERSR